ncbi:MAG: hypothetical protein AB1801_09585 [Chloroflexota bacterium]
MIAQALRGPHNLYRRYQALLESTVTAIGLAAVVTLALNSLSVYPKNWVFFMAAAIAIVGIRWPLAAYVLAVTVMIYPLYTLNLYLAVLFVAISALGQRLFVHYLGATVLVLATPILAQYHLHWLVPILGGLWWGSSGAWIGGIAAVWGKVLGGMAGLNLDWLVLAGQTPDVQAMAARFLDANSLNTLLLLIEPFADTSSVILYNLLQVIGWTVAGGFVGSLARRKWVKYRTPWSILIVTAGGGLILMATHLGLPYWLREAVSPETVLALQDPTGPLFSLLMVIIIGTAVYSGRESLDLPVAPQRSLRAARRPSHSRKTGGNRLVRLFRRAHPEQSGQPVQEPVPAEVVRRPLRVPHYSELPEWEPPKDDGGLIMLEID